MHVSINRRSKRTATSVLICLFFVQALSGQKTLNELRSNSQFTWMIDSASPRLSIYYQPGSVIANQLTRVREKILGQLDTVIKFMRVDNYLPEVHLFVVSSRQEMKSLIGWETNGTGFYKNNVVTGIATEKVWSIYSTHEFFHVLAMNTWGIPPTWLNEGMAVYADKFWHGYELHQLAHYLSDQGRFVPLERLVRRFRKMDNAVSYPLMGSFVKFLDEKYGRQIIRNLWTGKKNNLEKITKKKINELETEWMQTFKAEKYINISY